MKSFLTFGDKILSLSMKSRLKKDQETRIHHQIHNAWRVLPRTRYQTHFCQRLLVSVVGYLVCEVTLKLLQYCNYIIIVMQIKLMLLLLLLRVPSFT